MFKNLTNLTITSNLTRFEHLLRQKRHYMFVGNEDLKELCYRPRHFKENITEACKFVSHETSCTSSVKIFNYLKLFVCTFKMDNSALGATLASIATLIMLTLYLVLLYVNSRYFLLPNSIVLANYFNMKNYDFGVIILGPLFTLPGVLSLIFCCNAMNTNSSLLYAQGFGYMFTAFVIGLCLLAIRKDFKLYPPIFMREMLFWGMCICHIYFAVEWEASEINSPNNKKPNSQLPIHAYIMLTVYTVYALNIILFSRSRYRKPEKTKDPESLPSSSESIDSDSYPDFYENPIESEIDPFDLFIECISPKDSLKDVSMWLKVILSPFYCILAIFVPVVRRQRRLNGWCKGIVCVSFITFPFYFFKWKLGLLFNTTAIVLGIIYALVAFFLSHAQRLPINHDLVSLWGLIFGIAIFNLIDGEVGALVWQLLSYVANWKYDTIVILAFPLSYVFVEAIFLLTLLKNNYRKMASGFVIGVVMFIAYTTVPITVMTKCFKDQVFLFSARTTSAFYFMIIVQCITVFALSINGFVLRRSFSIFLIIVQAVYIIHMILANTSIMHPYGTVSIRSYYINAKHSNWA